MKELARRKGALGTIRILRRRRAGARLYCLDDGVQTMARPDGTSLFGYVHALKLLVRGAHRVLMIGGAGGSLATMLARRGHDVTVVDLEPGAEQIARRYFALHPGVAWVTADALDFLGGCAGVYDAVVIDACDGGGLIPAFTRRSGLTAALGALRPDGALLVNLSATNGAPDIGWGLAQSFAADGWCASLFRPEDGVEGNEILYLRAHGPAPTIDMSDLARRPRQARSYLSALRVYAP
jgi:spermidine synthase